MAATSILLILLILIAMPLPFIEAGWLYFLWPPYFRWVSHPTDLPDGPLPIRVLASLPTRSGDLVLRRDGEVVVLRHRYTVGRGSPMYVGRLLPRGDGSVDLEFGAFPALTAVGLPIVFGAFGGLTLCGGSLLGALLTGAVMLGVMGLNRAMSARYFRRLGLPALRALAHAASPTGPQDP